MAQVGIEGMTGKTEGKMEGERRWGDIEMRTEKAPSTPAIGDFPPVFRGFFAIFRYKNIFFPE